MCFPKIRSKAMMLIYSHSMWENSLSNNAVSQCNKKNTENKSNIDRKRENKIAPICIWDNCLSTKFQRISKKFKKPMP